MTAIERRGPVVLVPSERHVERARAEGVVTARRYFGRLAAELAPALRPASRAARRLATRQSLAESARHGVLGQLYGASAAERAAVISALDTTIGALRDAGATADALDATRTARGAELAMLWRDVDRRLGAAGLVDDRALPAPALLEAAWAAGDRPPVVVSGHASVRGAMLGALLAIHRGHLRAGGAGVTLQLPRFDDPEHPMSLLASRLEARLATEPDALEIEWIDPPAPTVRIVEAHGPDAEARAAAATVLEALDSGAPPETVALAIPSGDEALASPLRAALHEAGVAFSEPSGRPASSVPEVRAALSLLSMAARWLTRDGLIELLRLPGLHAGAFVGAADEIEAASRAGRLAHELRKLSIQRDLTGEGFVDALRAADDDGQRAWAAEAAGRMGRAISALRDVDRAGPLVRAWLELVSRLRLGEPSAREIADAIAAPATASLGALGEGATALRALRDAAEDLARACDTLPAPGRFDADDLLSEMEVAIDAARTTPPGGSTRAGALRLASIREVAGGSHGLVVVTGLAGAGHRPARVSLLLDENTRKRLPDAMRPPSHRERTLIAEAELAWALRASADLVLVYPTTDGDGREAGPPHPAVSRSLDAGAPLAVEPASRVSRGASTLSARGRELLHLANGGAPASDLTSRVAVERGRLAFFLDPRRAPDAHSGAVDESLTEDLARRFGGVSPDRTVPVSAIEAAASCPFKAFAGRVLGARAVDDVGDPLGPRERGDLVHRALHRAYEAAYALPPSATDARRIEEARSAAARAVELDAPSGPLRREGKRRIVDDVIALLADELAASPELTYRFGERRFGAGEGEPWGPLALPDEAAAAEGAAVWVEGRIDRVDASPDGRRIRVIDYKTSRAVPSTKKLGPAAFQLPLYAKVLARQGPTELSVAYVSAAAILAGHRKREAARVLDEDEIDAFAKRAAAVVASVWSGQVPPRPIHPSACRRCAARDICRKPAVVPPPDDDERGGGS